MVLGVFGLSAQERRGQEEPPLAPVIVAGLVVDHETGNPIRSAAVSLGSGPGGTVGVGTRVTGEDGRFIFREVPPGTYRLSVTILGYRTLRDTLTVPADADLDITLPLSVDPIDLRPIVVEAERQTFDLIDPRSRRRIPSRTFSMEREDIERRPVRFLTDLLVSVPGGRVVQSPLGGRTILLRNNCRPLVWIDGVRIPHEQGIDQLLSTMDVQSVDVYHGFDLPVEFGRSTCGGVVIWTRDRRANPDEPFEPPRRGFWRRFATATSLLIIVGLLISR